MEEQGEVWVCDNCENSNPDSFTKCIKCKLTRSMTTQAQSPSQKVSIFSYEQLKSLNHVEVDEENSRRILLVGIPGSGKSSLGNNLLGCKAFEACCSPNAVTLRPACGIGKWKDKETVIYDTPGIARVEANVDKDRFNTLVETISECCWFLSPGFHAVAFVINIGRLSVDTYYLLEDLQKIFGDDCLKFLFVVFTKIDELDDGQTLQSYLEMADERVRMLAKTCGYIGFNNKAKGYEMKRQIAAFFEKVDGKMQINNFKFYTNACFQEVHVIKQQMAKREGKTISEMRWAEIPKEVYEIVRHYVTKIISSIAQAVKYYCTIS